MKIVNWKLKIILIVIAALALGAGAFWYFYQSAETGLPTPADQPAYAGWEGYAHPELPFAFAHPEDLTPSAFADGGAEIILLEGKESGREAQIIVRAFDEPGPITAERIRRDLPQIVIDEPQTALIGSGQIPALLFWSSDASVGKTRELWFTQGGYLYQVTTSAEMDETLAKIMETWRFD